MCQYLWLWHAKSYIYQHQTLPFLVQQKEIAHN